MRGTGHTFAGLEEFAAKFPEMVGLSLRELEREVHLGLHERALELARQASPVGSRATGRPSLRASWRSFPPDPLSAIAAGRPTKVGTGAPHARIIEGGRKVARTYRRRSKGGKVARVRGRMIGSTQAPAGMVVPVLTQLAAEEERIVAAAIARVMGAEA
ncbi:MAG: hypothetical protein BWX64_02473 [Acidobacteria bacterium ADurb.Bin051]|jgi:hypothetical protein|nr:MAG: hypothetical protein BWX64_02473 [Acidobacteria bacterium ADurb.Bin051]